MLIGLTVGEIERELVLQTLARFDGNRTHAVFCRVIRAYPAHKIRAIFSRGKRRAQS